MLRKGAELLRLATAWLRIASHCKGIGLMSNAKKRNGPAMESKAAQRHSLEKHSAAMARGGEASQRRGTELLGSTMI